MRVYCLYFVLFSFFIFAASFFCYGFFPLSYSSSQKASLDELPKWMDDVKLNRTNYRAMRGKIILMIIDALRLDFVIRADDLVYLNKILYDNDACILKMKVHPPTVTMPRIKSLTSGTIPSFLDVVLNFGSAEFKTDTFLHQMVKRKENIIFFGDDTWTKLFPNMFFRQQENHDSLFVNDFYEGDKNITKHVQQELKNSDWKMMILHYLGLDHIGHVEGPYSPKIPIKLREMDAVIKEIHSQMIKWKLKRPPLFVITTDHGMRDSGGHGGSSFSEIYVPLILTGPICRDPTLYEQSDIATSLSIVLGLPIPKSSIGTVITHFIRDFDKESKLYAYYYNALHLFDKIKNVFDDDVLRNKEFFIQFEEAKALHKKFLTIDNDKHIHFKGAESKYIASNREIQSILVKNYIKYDLLSIAFGLGAVVPIYIAILFLMFVNNASEKIPIKPFLIPILMLFFLVLCLKQSWGYIFSLEPINLLYDVVFSSIFVMIILVYQFIYKLFSHFNIPRISSLPISVRLIISAIALHSISPTSSSFIEEEHQIWYYFISTSFLMLFFNELKTKKNNQYFKYLWEWTFIFVLHIFLRRLNQTGDKWLDMPDVSDFLIQEENKILLSWFVFAGLCLVYYALQSDAGFLSNILIVITLILIYYYRAINDAVVLFGLKSSKSHTCLIIFWLGILELMCINYLPIIYKKIKHNTYSKSDIKQFLNMNVIIFTLIATLLHKPHNIILNAGCILTCNFMSAAIDRQKDTGYNTFIKTIVHIWLGKVFYFYQGNSNSLASIDLNAGYIGLEKFNIYFVGFFLTWNTYNGQILSYLLLLRNLIQPDNKDTSIRNLKAAMCIMISNIIIPLASYIVIVTFFRNHIFVWTVFSPKIIYEIFFMFVFYLIILITYLLITYATKRLDLETRFNELKRNEY